MAIQTQRNKGVVAKKTKEMFNKSERKFIAKQLDKLHISSVNGHCKTRKIERGIEYTAEQFQNAINFGTFKEVQRYEDGTTRFLFRDKKVLHNTSKGEANCVFVVTVDTKDVRSCWLNNVNDHHKTLDTSVYDENANIYEWFK